jgi:hypothetical protein
MIEGWGGIAAGAMTETVIVRVVRTVMIVIGSAAIAATVRGGEMTAGRGGEVTAGRDGEMTAASAGVIGAMVAGLTNGEKTTAGNVTAAGVRRLAGYMRDHRAETWQADRDQHRVGWALFHCRLPASHMLYSRVGCTSGFPPSDWRVTRFVFFEAGGATAAGMSMGACRMRRRRTGGLRTRSSGSGGGRRRRRGAARRRRNSMGPTALMVFGCLLAHIKAGNEIVQASVDVWLCWATPAWHGIQVTGTRKRECSCWLCIGR